MIENIKEFTYVTNPSFSDEENLRIKNRSSHDNNLHQLFFNIIDEDSKMVIKDIHNSYASALFSSNNLNIVGDEHSIEQTIVESLKRQGHKVTSLSNPEMIYKAFNFIKPPNLLPKYNNKLILIKQSGISESGKEVNYVLNPFFFGFKISLDIYIHTLFCSEYLEDLEAGLLNILTDKYGDSYRDIYNYVVYVGAKAANAGKENGDQNDETFIAGIQSISGINDSEIVTNFIYESAMLTASQKADILKKQ